MDLFSNILGQPQATALLLQALSHNRIAPAYLFAGPAGIGKRLTAQRFALALLTPARATLAYNLTDDLANDGPLNAADQPFHPDLLWVEPTYLHQGQRLTAAEAEQTGLKRRSPPQIRLEQVRDLTRFLGRPPLKAPRSVVVVDGAELMAEAAANALLKTLEEPGNATLLLVSHNSDRLLPTLISRCQKIPFQRLSQDAMAAVLRRTGAEELLQRQDLLALAQGSPGRAIAAMRQWHDLPEDLRAAMAERPADLRQALTLARSIAAALDVEAQLWVTDYLQHQYCSDQYYSDQYYGDQHYSGQRDLSRDWGKIRHRLQTLEQARQQLQGYVQPRLVWEVALMSLAGVLP